LTEQIGSDHRENAKEKNPQNHKKRDANDEKR